LLPRHAEAKRAVAGKDIYMKRRKFLKVAAVSAAVAPAATGASSTSNQAIQATDLKRPVETVRGDMRYRQLGRTGEEVSIIGLGGHHIGRQKEEKDSIAIIRTAIDAGINFLDNCWDYHDGGSEVRMGKALADGYRRKAFLMTKIDGRTKKAARQQLDESLRRLKTDVIDLVQHHEIIRLEDPDRVFAEGGAQEALLEAKKAGKIRFIGFTGHKDPLVHLRMLEVAAQHSFRFDAVQMPLNVMDAHFRSFEHNVLPVLVREEIGVLGMKSMADGIILKSNAVSPIECLHYAMSLPTSTVITGIDSLEILRQDLEAVRTFQFLTADQIRALLNRTSKLAAEGRYERFKTTNGFDGTAQNPAWLGANDAGPS
jgi:aryl-alcohol dehydrogenase-like predicted oxidoreductase